MRRDIFELWHMQKLQRGRVRRVDGAQHRARQIGPGGRDIFVQHNEITTKPAQKRAGLLPTGRGLY